MLCFNLNINTPITKHICFPKLPSSIPQMILLPSHSVKTLNNVLSMTLLQSVMSLDLTQQYGLYELLCSSVPIVSTLFDYFSSHPLFPTTRASLPASSFTLQFILSTEILNTQYFLLKTFQIFLHLICLTSASWVHITIQSQLLMEPPVNVLFTQYLLNIP